MKHFDVANATITRNDTTYHFNHSFKMLPLNELITKERLCTYKGTTAILQCEFDFYNDDTYEDFFFNFSEVLKYIDDCERDCESVRTIYFRLITLEDFLKLTDNCTSLTAELTVLYLQYFCRKGCIVGDIVHDERFDYSARKSMIIKLLNEWDD